MAKKQKTFGVFEIGEKGEKGWCYHGPTPPTAVVCASTLRSAGKIAAQYLGAVRIAEFSERVFIEGENNVAYDVREIPRWDS